MPRARDGGQPLVGFIVALHACCLITRPAVTRSRPGWSESDPSFTSLVRTLESVRKSLNLNVKISRFPDLDSRGSGLWSWMSSSEFVQF